MNANNLSRKESIKQANELLYAGSHLCEAVERMQTEAVERLYANFQDVARLASLFTTVAKKVTGGDL